MDDIFGAALLFGVTLSVRKSFLFTIDGIGRRLVLPVNR